MFGGPPWCIRSGVRTGDCEVESSNPGLLHFGNLPKTRLSLTVREGLGVPHGVLVQVL